MRYLWDTQEMTQPPKLVGWKLVRSASRYDKPLWDVHDSATCSRSYKQKLKTNSSTDAELIAIYDAQVRYCGPDQGRYVPTTTIYQKMHTSPECQIHFVTDKINKEDVKVAFWPTTDMLGDFFKSCCRAHNSREKTCLTCLQVQIPMFAGVCWRIEKNKVSIKYPDVLETPNDLGETPKWLVNKVESKNTRLRPMTRSEGEGKDDEMRKLETLSHRLAHNFLIY